MVRSQEAAEGRKIWGLHHNVFFTGITSFLTDISSEMIFNLLPLYLTNVVGASVAVAGIVSGVTEGADAGLRMLGGWFSDRIGARKGLAVAGYAIAAIVKPFLYIANSWGAVLAVRFGDRLGKGIRSSSRDALIADSVTKEQRGRAFGMHRAMDTAGAFVGVGLAALVVWLVLGPGAVVLTRKVFQYLVLGAIIPAVLGVVIMQVAVHEARPKDAPRTVARWPLSGVKGAFEKRFWIVLAIVAVFNIGSMPANYSVILRAQNLQAPILELLLMLVMFNAVYAIGALPMGTLSDKLGRRRVLALGWLVYAIVYVGFALSSTIWQVWVAFAGLGLYSAMVDGVSRAFVADMAPAEKRGTAYGLYYCVVGVSVLVGGIVGGQVWDHAGPAASFYVGAALALLAMIGIVTLVKEPKPLKNAGC